MSTPGAGRFGPRVDQFDQRIDSLLEQVRGTPALDKLMTAATHAGEFSAIWHVLSMLRGTRKHRHDQVIALAIGLGAESLILNQGLKRIFRRERPTEAGDDRFAIRKPLTSSFPSGHASAAAFAAITLIRWDGKRSILMWGGVAAVVAVSRPYVRIHHASDVVGGIIAGTAMAAVAKRIFRVTGIE